MVRNPAIPRIAIVTDNFLRNNWHAKRHYRNNDYTEWKKYADEMAKEIEEVLDSNISSTEIFIAEPFERKRLVGNLERPDTLDLIEEYTNSRYSENLSGLKKNITCFI